MKVADVYYDGRSLRHSRRGPTDERYNFSRGQGGAPDVPAEVESITDALYFDRTEDFRVEWTALGHVARQSQALDAPSSGIEAMLTDMGYRQKQKLAKRLGLKAHGTEDELTERLQPEIERLEEQMENL